MDANRRPRTLMLTLAGLALLVPALSALPATAGAARAAAGTTAQCPWVTSSAPLPQRVDMLLSAMTVQQMDDLVYGNGSYAPAGYVGHIPAIPALCIPALNLEDGPEGVADGMTGVTQLPAGVSLAATWDASTAREYGTVIGSEEAGKGANVNLGPTVNIVRDPRWGRAFESYGEDPYLSGQIAVGDIDGVQSQGVMSMVKHWDVYNQETNRNTPADDAIVSERTMQEIYMPQFRAAVQQGHAAAVMCSYATINGTYACQNSYIDSVMDKEFGFQGFITSDWGANHSTVPSALAGLDMEMPFGTYYSTPLLQAVQDGQVPLATLKEMARRILTQMFRFGLFTRPATGSTSAVVTTPAHAAVARQVSEEGTVLLKNEGGLLPLSASRVHSIAVIGDDAGPDAMSSGEGSAAVTAPYLVTPYQGIAERAGSGVSVSYAQGNPPATGDLPVLPASALPGGLAVQYFNNTTLSGTPAATATATDISYTWNGNAPAPGVNATGWSARWTGLVQAPSAGTYEVTVDGGSGNGTRLYVGGKLVVNNWAGAQSSPVRALVHLPAGNPVSIEVDYAQTAAAGSFGLSDSLSLGWADFSALENAAVTSARSADVAVVFAGYEESEGSDRTDINLDPASNALISAVAAANRNTVVVLNTGSAVTMPWLGAVRGVFEAWYPGQEDGNAIAALLFGDADPSGKLPVTFPVSLADVPARTPQQWPGVDGKVDYSEGLLVGYRWYDARHIQPLFPFGYGLSYTSFRFSGLRVERSGDHVAVRLDVTNTGRVAGADVAQVYVGDPASTGEPPEQLKAFQRVELEPGQTAQVALSLDSSSFAQWDTSASAWTVTPGLYRIMVGDSSASLPLQAAVWLGP
jgi:beta-glucosidase